MTITPLDIYLVSLADDIVKQSGCIAGLCLFAFIVLFLLLGVIIDTEEQAKKCKGYMKTIGIVFVVCLAVNTFTPSSKTIAAMFVVPAIVNNEHVQNSAGNALGVLEELTKQWLKDTIKDNASKEEAHI